MEFKLSFTPKSLQNKIAHHHKIFLAGSCFTEQIGAKLLHHKFQIKQNPNGILFNPASISKSIRSYIVKEIYKEEDLFLHNELWGSWDHHTRFSSVNKMECLDAINASQTAAHDFLKTANWIILTLGSAFVYEWENERVVANCHKVPTDKFKKRLLSVAAIKSLMQSMVAEVMKFNESVKIIFTISPVRHLRDGFVENNRSKANLITAVHELVEENAGLFYFPSYELIIDDLRDYRFFAEDMVHPNYLATQYVWEKFVTSCVEDQSQMLMKEIAVINAAKSHKPFNPTSGQHQLFLKTNLEKARALQEQYSYLDLTEEITYFSQFL